MPYNDRFSAIASSLNSFAQGWAQMAFRTSEQDRRDANWEKAFQLRKVRNDFEMDMSRQNFNLQERQFNNQNKQWKLGFDLQSDQQKWAEKTWQKDFEQKGKFYSDSIAQKTRAFNFEKTKWEGEKALRSANLAEALSNKELADFNTKVTQAIQYDTQMANEYIYGKFGELLKTDDSERDDAFVGLVAETKASLPNANTKPIETLYNILSESKSLKSGQTGNWKKVETISAQGKKQVQFIDSSGKTVTTIDKGEMSDGLVTLTNYTREQLQKRRDEKMKLYLLSLKAKFGGELSAAVTTINDLNVSAREIIGMSDQLFADLENDPEILAQRKKFERELVPLVKDEKARKEYTDAMFGPAPSLTQEAHDETVKGLSKQYQELLGKDIILEPDMPKQEILSFYYKKILSTSEGREREWQVDSILAAGKKSLTAEEYSELLIRMDAIAEEYSKELEAQKAARIEQRRAQAQAIRDQNSFPLQPMHENTSNNEMLYQPMEMAPQHSPSKVSKGIPWWAVGTPGYGE